MLTRRDPASVSEDPTLPEQNSGSGYLSALPHPVLVLSADDRLTLINSAAEHFFGFPASQMAGRALSRFVPADSPLYALMAAARERLFSVSEEELQLGSARRAAAPVSIHIAPTGQVAGELIISFFPMATARKLDQQLFHRQSARSVAGAAAMLAHELKNPLSGIKGAAQLLGMSAGEDDQPLTQLIVDETDRITKLIDQMELFSDSRPVERAPLNIHLVLDHVKLLARSGFGAAVRFTEIYDPSLPDVQGNREQLIQAVLNLIKNACEALGDVEGAEIRISSRYCHGVRLSVPGTAEKVELPIEIVIEDNGPGIAEGLQKTLFEPFVSSKRNGRGLGLSLVAKIIQDHGGVIEAESQPRRTRFRMLLPVARRTGTAGAEA